MTGPHLIIVSIFIACALLSLRLMRERSEARATQGAVSLSLPGHEPVIAAPHSPRPVVRSEDPVTDPVLAVRQACLAMEEEARRREVDLLRPYSVSVPAVAVPRGPLVALLKSVLQNALDATPRKGAVICMIKMTAHHVHFVISDSSGCAEDGAALLADTHWRNESLSPSKMVSQAMGGRLLYTDHPGEGVVIDIAFERLDVKNTNEPKSFSAWVSGVGNDRSVLGETPHTRPNRIASDAVVH